MQVRSCKSQGELHSPPAPQPIHSGQPPRQAHQQCSETYPLNQLPGIAGTCHILEGEIMLLFFIYF